MNKEIILSSLNFKDFYTQHIPSLKINGKAEAMGLCPFHDDKHPSLSVNVKTGLYHCFACSAKGDVFGFYQQLKGVDFPTALNELGEMQGIVDTPKGRVVATFEYTDAGGKILYAKERVEPGRNGKLKEFFFKHLAGDKWITGRGCEPVPYNLPLMAKSKYALIVEGEAKADLLTRQFGLVATCFDSGAQSPFKEDYLKYFEGKDKIIILPDNDVPGKAYANKIANALYGKVKAIKIINLPGLQEAEDIINWVNDYRDNRETEDIKKELLAIVHISPEWTPPKNQDTQTGGMPLIKLSDLLKEPDELVPWLVDKTLPSGGFSVIAAKPKVGKSTIARNLALSVAKGEPFLDKPVSKGSVIYYALEEKKSEVKKHFQDMGADGTEDIYIYTGGTPVDAIRQIREVVESIRPALIIVDPLFRLTKIKDGNDYAQVMTALEPLSRLARDTGAHVLCVHHSGKGDRQSGDSVLGSTAIFGSVDTLLIMKRLEAYRTISSFQRYGDDLPETTLHFDKNSRTVEIGKPKIEEDIDSLKKAIIEFLSSQGEPVIKPVIMDEVEGRAVIKRKALTELVRDGRITRDGEGGKGSPYKYTMSLCPNIYRDIGTQNPENSENPCQQRVNGVSQENAVFTEDDKSRVIAFSPPKGQEDAPCSRCMLTPAMRVSCEVIKPKLCPKMDEGQ